METPDQHEDFPVSKPPEGAIVGEDVPVENDRDEIVESNIEEMMNNLKQLGEPYTEMKDSELRSKAKKLINQQ